MLAEMVIVGYSLVMLSEEGEKSLVLSLSSILLALSVLCSCSIFFLTRTSISSNNEKSFFHESVLSALEEEGKRSTSNSRSECLTRMLVFAGVVELLIMVIINEFLSEFAKFGLLFNCFLYWKLLSTA